MDQNRIIVFVKNVVPGKVKTRLAKTLGNKEALKVYVELLDITKQAVLQLPVNKEVWYAWNVEQDDLWDENEFNKRVQIEGDLGEKMSNAFKTSFEEGMEKVILIGSDCPTLTGAIMEEAFNKLNENDVVFGPSKDGGYYLIGMSSYCPEVLTDIAWSTEEVMEQTEQRAKDHNLRLAKLEPLNDIDNESDWNEYLATKVDD
ncbi:MAG: TIGR04282 family arsenosugar biosynthesis glycosyltransferase [Balneola sp.]